VSATLSVPDVLLNDSRDQQPSGTNDDLQKSERGQCFLEIGSGPETESIATFLLLLGRVTTFLARKIKARHRNHFSPRWLLVLCVV